MPCYSSITETQMSNLDRLIQALADNKIKVYGSNSTSINTSIGSFSRSSSEEGFGFSGSQKDLAPVGRKYAELGVREWAKRAGMSITGTEGNKIRLTQRR